MIFVKVLGEEFEVDENDKIEIIDFDNTKKIEISLDNSNGTLSIMVKNPKKKDKQMIVFRPASSNSVKLVLR